MCGTYHRDRKSRFVYHKIDCMNLTTKQAEIFLQIIKYHKQTRTNHADEEENLKFPHMSWREAWVWVAVLLRIMLAESKQNVRLLLLMLLFRLVYSQTWSMYAYVWGKVSFSVTKNKKESFHFEYVKVKRWKMDIFPFVVLLSYGVNVNRCSRKIFIYSVHARVQTVFPFVFLRQCFVD